MDDRVGARRGVWEGSDLRADLCKSKACTTSRWRRFFSLVRTLLAAKRAVPGHRRQVQNGPRVFKPLFQPLCTASRRTSCAVHLHTPLSAVNVPLVTFRIA